MSLLSPQMVEILEARMKLVVPTKGDCEQVRIWRNEWLESTRTPYMLTKEMQEDFYNNVICNRNSTTKYWVVFDDSDDLLGATGLVPIQWENRIAEIALVVNPEKLGKGYGAKIVELVLDKAFNYLNLKTVFGECYFCNKALAFWKDITAKYNGTMTILPNRKFWNGKYYDSLYFSIDKKDYAKQ